MKFTFLGTAASEKHPAVFCRCENCEGARRLGGRNVRACSSAHLGPDCAIDFNADTPLRAQEYAVSLPELRYLLVTHIHADHFTPNIVRYRRMSPAVSLPVSEDARHGKDCVGVRFCELPMLNVYGTGRVCDALRTDGADPDPDVHRIGIHQVEYFETFEAGDMVCVPLKANHMLSSGEPGLNYIIQRDGRNILYALDTGWFLDETLARISEHQYDLVVVDGTFGLGREDPDGHMNLPLVEKALSLFRERNLLKPGAPFCVSHLCPHWTPIHDEIAPLMAEKGVTVAYDGLALDL